jgi:actin-like ATPase involved in cell morphogenesis
MAPSYRLGVDFGTSTTVAMLHWPDGRIRPLLFDSSPLLPSAVVLDAAGRLHTGRDAAHLARRSPERLEPNPKRRIDDEIVLLGEVGVSVRDLISTVLRRVAAEATRVAGPLDDVTLTHPAAWGPNRRSMLVDAALHAGLARPNLVAEPVAAAAYLAHGMGTRLPSGAPVLIYDLGAGTCDVTLLRRQPRGFDVIGSDGLGDVGGLDVDAAVVAFLQATYGVLWDDAATRRHLWEEVRAAKEMLSRASGTLVTVPALGKEVPLGREQLEGLARPVLQPTIELTQALLRQANVDARTVAGPFLVGGSSRIPLVATLLHEALGIAPVVTEQPELVVAEGALYLTAAPPAAPPRPAPPMPVPHSVSGPPGHPVSGLPSHLVSGPPARSGPPVPPGRPGPPPQPFPSPLPPPLSAPRPMRPVRPTAARQGRRIAAIAGAAAVAVLLLLIGGTATAYQWLNRDKGNQSGPDSGRFGLDSSDPSASKAPAKYDMRQVPENLCEKVDLSALAATFEKESNTPDARRNVSSYLGTSNCLLSRQHNGRDDLAISIATLSFSMYVFTDSDGATDSHERSISEAKLNTPTITDVPNFGQHAFIYRKAGNTAAPEADADYVLEARDANLRWTASLSATKMSGGKWTDAERADLEARFITVAKASFTKLSGGA